MAHSFDLDKTVNLNPKTTNKLVATPVSLDTKTGVMTWGVSDGSSPMQDKFYTVVLPPNVLNKVVKAMVDEMGAKLNAVATETPDPLPPVEPPV